MLRAMSALLVSVSGVRGIVGTSFTEERVRTWAGAFAQFCRPERSEGPQRDSSAASQNGTRVVLGRDTRPSGAWALELSAKTFEDHGVSPVIVGIVPTPTVQLAVTYHRADGGLVITGSHNPGEWNALKFLGPDGVFLSAEEMQRLHQRVILSEAQPFDLAQGKLREGSRRDSSSPLAPQNDIMAIQRHIENILALPVDVERIRKRRFRIVLDPVNGTGALALPSLLERLGCQVTVINGEANGNFAHSPEPTPENLQDLGAAVREARADLGVAVDPDADRLVLVDECGIVLSEEYTVTLVVMSVLSRRPQTSGVCTVVNLSTTRMVDDVAARFGAHVIRTPVGERHVVEGMRERGALIGGEGNGGVIFRTSHEGRDALVGIALLLDLLARRGISLAGLVTELPTYMMRKEKLPRTGTWDMTRMDALLARAFPDAPRSTIDGVRVDTADGWIHLRPSNTEPIVRLIGEARTESALNLLFERARAVVVPAVQ